MARPKGGILGHHILILSISLQQWPPSQYPPYTIRGMSVSINADSDEREEENIDGKNGWGREKAG